ncbi:hypothetical protein BGZ65_007855 [Modicella reniformis]|uniref:Uncharacterized protein n=1 Tax=Modicella reniformis TaxID=1440133 RepID=A0A9P6JH91_9FUNG|nr:hypothetical protein BGZ65_007855 [Modicella reniformis]
MLSPSLTVATTTLSAWSLKQGNKSQVDFTETKREKDDSIDEDKEEDGGDDCEKGSDKGGYHGVLGPAYDGDNDDSYDDDNICRADQPKEPLVLQDKSELKMAADALHSACNNAFEIRCRYYSTLLLD